MADEKLYNDGRVACDQEGIRIAWYYPWGAKRIPYTSLKAVDNLPLTGINKIRRWRIWGSGDFVHWWNLDPGRTHKQMALVLDAGHHIRPTITPDDPGAVERILRERILGGRATA